MATKITYATLGGEQLDDLHRALDDAIAKAPNTFGREYLLYTNGQPVKAEQQFEDRSPIDTSILIGKFQEGTREHVRSAIAAARSAYPAWAARPWQQRLAIVRRIAEAIRAHRYELSALMGYEAGKNRLGRVRDAEGCAELIGCYAGPIELHKGLCQPGGAPAPGAENA